MFDLTILERRTFLGALALAFSDAVTGKPVTDYLRIQAYRFDLANLTTARDQRTAQKSKASSVFGFRTMPGLERYQNGGALAAGSVSYLVHIVDEARRYLPQLHRIDLPLATPAVQTLELYPAPSYITPAGYGTLRGSLLHTTPAPTLNAIRSARWASVTALAPGINPSDPIQTYRGFADANGQFLMCVAYPMIGNNTLLNEATWDVDISVQYQPASFDADLSLLGTVLPFLTENIVPFQATLDAQSDANMARSVNVIDAEAQQYAAVAIGSNPLTETMSFGETLLIRTQISGTDSFLSELLVVPT